MVKLKIYININIYKIHNVHTCIPGILYIHVQLGSV
jgi:hypothetical protein